VQRIRDLGELKNQTLGTEDITKAYFDTDSHLKNARVMEQRFDRHVEKEKRRLQRPAPGREGNWGGVREQIEQMQGELKYWDSQVQFATVTIQLTRKTWRCQPRSC